jgi:hypothetical protein
VNEIIPDDILQMGQRVAQLKAAPEFEAMSPIRRELEFQKAAWGSRPLNDFLLTNGRDYQIGPDTFAGPRGEVHGCYKNATHLALEDDALTYVEGKVATCGIAIDHAWCVTADGMVIDPTLEPARADDTFARVGGYFGVPFRTDYLHKAILANGHYGLLDIMSAPLTLPQLVDLGLEAGQQWLLDQKKPLKRKRRARR